jgi:hypothetical protein
MAGAVAGLIGSLQRTTAYAPSFVGTLSSTFSNGVVYNNGISGSNFTTASVTAGAVPTGTAFGFTANSSMNVSGTPTTDGTYNFTVTAVNNPGGGLTQTSLTFSYTITVTTATNKRCTTAQISYACCTNTSSCGPLGAGVTCSPASGSFSSGDC